MKRIFLTAALAALATSVFAQDIPQTLNLSQAFALLERENPVVLAARLKAMEAEMRAAATRSGWGPQLNLTAGQQYQTSNLQGIGLVFPGAGPRIGPYRVFDVRPRLSQTVLDLSLWSASRAAKLRAQADAAGSEAETEKVRLAVVELYVQAVQADSRRRAAEARVESAEAVLRQARDREQAGTGNKLDVARAQEQLERERAGVVGALRDRNVTVAVLMRTLGVESAVQPTLEEISTTKSGVDVTLEAALQGRAEMRVQALLGASYREERRAAEGARWPKVIAQGDFGVTGRDPSRNLSTYMVGVGVSVPLWTSGRIANEIKAAEYRAQRQKQEERQVRLEISRDLEKARIEREAMGRITELTSNAAAAARTSLELALLRYGAGLATQLDVTTAQSELAQAEEDEIRARYDMVLAAARMAGAAGRLREFADGQ